MEIILVLAAIALAVVAVYYLRRGFLFVVGFIRRYLGWFILGLLIFILIFWAGSCAINAFSSDDEERTQEEVIQEKQEETPESPVPQKKEQLSPTPAQQVWTFQTFEPLPKEGRRVYLYPYWAGFPLGGKIKYKTPDGTIIIDSDKEVLKPTPAESKSIKQEGWYTFYPYEGKGVRIYNCWTCQQRL